MKAFFLGRRAYTDVLAFQQQLLEAKVARQALRRRSPEALAAPLPDVALLVEHSQPVYTIGRRDTSHGLPPSTRVEVVRTRRGGGLTCHGPGQLTMYPIANIHGLWKAGRSERTHRSPIQWYTACLARSMVLTSAHYGVPTHEDTVGVWADPYQHHPARKIGSIGLQLTSWVSMHGAGYNISNDLRHFDAIEMCELPGRSATSLHAELHARGLHAPPPPSVADVAPQLLQHFLQCIDPDRPAPPGPLVDLAALPDTQWQPAILRAFHHPA